MLGKIAVGALLLTGLGYGSAVSGVAHDVVHVGQGIWDQANIPDPNSQDAAYARTCPIVGAYFKVDAVAQQAISPGLLDLARKQTLSADPAVRAFAETVRPALSNIDDVARQDARALLSRECSNAGHALP